METGTCRLAAVCLAGLALAAGGCGASGGARRDMTSSTQRSVRSNAGSRPGTSAALRAGPPPASWGVARVSAGGALYYPPGWRLARGDVGTATAVLVDAGQRILGYLNLTPRRGGETLANWPTFRISHNIAEGERDVRREGTVYRVRFRTGIGTCVRDSYATVSSARFIELACLIRGLRAPTVIVGAAPPASWTRVSPLLYRAISALIA
jgi:hypothetical protein